MTAAVIPMRPRAKGDAESLWRDLCAARERMEAHVRAGHTDYDMVLACGDAYRAWLRAYTRDRIA